MVMTILKETTTHQMTIHDWLEHAQPGDRYIYYTGNLAQDLGNKTKCKQVPSICSSLFNSIEKGNQTITLAQRRVGLKFEYLVIRLKGKNTWVHQL